MRIFGNPTFLKEETRETWGWLWLEQMTHYFRYAARMLQSHPVVRKNSVRAGFRVDVTLLHRNRVLVLIFCGAQARPLLAKWSMQ